VGRASITWAIAAARIRRKARENLVARRLAPISPTRRLRCTEARRLFTGVS